MNNPEIIFLGSEDKLEEIKEAWNFLREFLQMYKDDEFRKKFNGFVIENKKQKTSADTEALN